MEYEGPTTTHAGETPWLSAIGQLCGYLSPPQSRCLKGARPGGSIRVGLRMEDGLASASTKAPMRTNENRVSTVTLSRFCQAVAAQVPNMRAAPEDSFGSKHLGNGCTVGCQAMDECLVVAMCSNGRLNARSVFDYFRANEIDGGPLHKDYSVVLSPGRQDPNVVVAEVVVPLAGPDDLSGLVEDTAEIIRRLSLQTAGLTGFEPEPELVAGVRDHPIIVTYRESLSSGCPLVLVIGREPNCRGGIADRVGRYDFDEFPRCGFWNCSYSMLARGVGIGTWELKRRCREQERSPLVYADALAAGILSSVADKGALRRRHLTEDAARAHVERIFAHREVICHVKAIVLSGLQESIYDATRKAVATCATGSGIPVFSTEFFYGTNLPGIHSQLAHDPVSAERLARVTRTALGLC